MGGFHVERSSGKPREENECIFKSLRSFYADTKNLSQNICLIRDGQITTQCFTTRHQIFGPVLEFIGKEGEPDHLCSSTDSFFSSLNYRKLSSLDLW